MKGNAEYYLIDSLGDYKIARQFIRDQGDVEDHPLSFPTIVAIDQAGDVLGVLSTDTSQNMVIAGPLVIKRDLRAYRVVIGLIDAYDTVMRDLGISSYIHSVDEDNTQWLRMIERVYEAKPYAHERGRLFFIKHLDTQPGANRSIH